MTAADRPDQPAAPAEPGKSLLRSLARKAVNRDFLAGQHRNTL